VGEEEAMKEVAWMKEGLMSSGTPEATEGEPVEPQGAAVVPGAPDPEVPEKALRRKFSAEYKLRILQLADSCSDPGSLGRLLRREGLYSSNLTTWRRQRELGMLRGLEPAKRGRKAIERNPLQPELDKLSKENERLQKRLKRAELIIEVQKKVSQILGVDLPEEPQES
jgi:transposase-like protein